MQTDNVCHCPCCREGITAPHEYHLESRPMAQASPSATPAAVPTSVLGVPVARLLHWNAPSHIPVPHGGICARTFTEFPKGAGEGAGYWKEGAALFAAPVAQSAAVPLVEPCGLRTKIEWLSEDSVLRSAAKRAGTVVAPGKLAATPEKP